jgi:hypothetical protein
VPAPALLVGAAPAVTPAGTEEQDHGKSGEDDSSLPSHGEKHITGGSVIVTDVIVTAWLRIPVPIRRFACATLLRKPASTAHRGFGGWAPFRAAVKDWSTGRPGSP